MADFEDLKRKLETILKFKIKNLNEDKTSLEHFLKKEEYEFLNDALESIGFANSLNFCRKITMKDSEVEYLATSLRDTPIKNLILSDCQICDTGARYLANNVINQLTHIDLEFNNIGDEGIRHIANSLRGSQLKQLNLRQNNIGVDGARYLSDALPDSPVQILILQENHISNDGIGYLANVLKNFPLKELNVARNRIGVEGIKELANGLKYSRVKCLNIKGNYVEDEGTIFLSTVLKDTKIKKLNMQDTWMTDKGLGCLANVLKDTRIEILNLGNNFMDSAGIRKLVIGLKDSQVQNLNLESCCLHDEAVGYLALGLRYSQVQVLCLKDNFIFEEGGEYLLKGLRNTNVSVINLDGNYVYCDNVRNRVNKLVAKNYHNVVNMRDNFKHLVSKNTEDGHLVFQVPTDREDNYVDIERYLNFIQSIQDTPNIIPTNMINDSGVVFKNHEIVQFIENISIQFSEFLSKFVEIDNFEYVNLLKKCEEMELDDIVEDLLLNRGACQIETANQDVLYPYVYVLLSQYKLPLHFDDQVFKSNKQEIIEYFQDHPDLEYAKEAIQLLQNINENKRRKLK